MRRPNFTYFESVGPFATPTVRRGRRQVVEAWQRGLLFCHGALVATLDPGAFRRWGSGYTLRRVDIRPWVLTAPTQEIPTSDGVSVRVTVSGVIAVTDIEKFSLATQNAHEALYLAVQVALREIVSATTVDELLAARADFGARLTAAVRGLGDIGLEVRQLELKDIVLPPDLKRAQAEVLVARAEGQAALERARSESAALRNLANAARLAADNPALLQLRLVQSLEAGTGNTVVFGQPVFPLQDRS
jgi:regulator of protease activity HflC (stomatin/prohibitin superfamily)